jgi:hypothetical protein
MRGVALMGRRKDCYTDEQKDEIIAHVLVNVASGRAVTTIFAEDDMPCHENTFWKWYFVDEELRGKLAHARENGMEARMEQAVHVARTPMMGEVVTIEPGGEGEEIRKVRQEDMLGHRKLLVDTLIKSVQMLKPKTYGPKLDVTSGGEKLGLAEEIEQHRRYMIENMPKLPAPGDE